MMLVETFDFFLLLGILMVDRFLFLSLEIVDSRYWIHPFDCASDIHIGVYSLLTLRSLLVVGLYGYPYS